ncbi:hypothetical protein [Streptomyces sp. BE303]|nr:hypothetical protein [Streptomyces sp. BE303]
MLGPDLFELPWLCALLGSGKELVLQGAWVRRDGLAPAGRAVEG